MPSYNGNALFFEKYFDARPFVIPPCSSLNLNQTLTIPFLRERNLVC